MRRFKLFVVCLSTIFTQALYAQDFRTSESQKDSVVIMHENGDEEVRYIFRAIEPERIADTTQVGVNPSATNIELQSITPETSTRSISSLSSYAVGSIPIQSGVTPTGGKTYTIPITTFPGYHLVPNISLYYNSQSGNGVAGYGWSIA